MDIPFWQSGFSCLGYCTLQHDIEKEARWFKTLHHINAPKKISEPKAPDFKKLKLFKSGFYYYCQTPILPDWLNVID